MCFVFMMLPNSEIREKHVFGSEARFLYRGHCCYIPAGSPARWASAWSPLVQASQLSAGAGVSTWLPLWFRGKMSPTSALCGPVTLVGTGEARRRKLCPLGGLQTAETDRAACVFVETHPECQRVKRKSIQPT